jgi:hypothetical protein
MPKGARLSRWWRLADLDFCQGAPQSADLCSRPASSVANEDPALSRGTASRNNKTVFWSYPLIKDGLIYVIDIRNGLFVFNYTGPHADEVKEIHFLEGNSNLGDAVNLDQNQNSQ